MFKRFLSIATLLLVFTIIFTVLPFHTQAASIASSGKCGTNVNWMLNNSGVLTISGTGEMTEYTYYTQVPWYSQRAAIKSVIVEKGVTNVAPYSFYYCTNLTSVSMSSTVLSIGASAFESCSSLTNVTIGSAVKTIGVSAFYDCSALESVTISSSVSAIGYGAFCNCINLQKVYAPTIANWCGISFTGNLANPLYYADELYINGKLTTDIVIPSGITKIPNFAFCGWNGITSITVPDSVVEIGTSAFYQCENLSSVQLGSGLQKIGNYAFKECGKVFKISIPASVSTIGTEAFLNSGLEEASYGGSKTQWDAISVGAGNTVLSDLLWSVDLFDFAGANLVLGDSLTMHFYVNKADLGDATDVYAVITRVYGDGKDDHVLTIPYSEWEVYSSSRMRFSYQGIAAKEMTDVMYVTIYSSNGTQLSNQRVESVRTYAHRALAGTTNGEFKTALVDMLNYGAAAQNMFTYNTDDLANSQLTAEQAGYATDSITYVNNQVKDSKFAGGSLTLENRLVLNMYFNGVDKSMTAVVTYTDSYGKARELRISGSEFVTRGSMLGVPVAGLNIADGRSVITCTIYNSDGTKVATGIDSVESFVARAAASDETYVYIMKFVESAYNYLH